MSHPLLVEIEGKLGEKLNLDDLAQMQAKGERFRQIYLDHPRNREAKLQ